MAELRKSEFRSGGLDGGAVIDALRAGGELINTLGSMRSEDWLLVGATERQPPVRRVTPTVVNELACAGFLRIIPVSTSGERLVRARLASPEQRRSRFRVIG